MIIIAENAMTVFGAKEDFIDVEKGEEVGTASINGELMGMKYNGIQIRFTREDGILAWMVFDSSNDNKSIKDIYEELGGIF